MISIWRTVHLFLAIIISLFLIVVSITGAILSADTVINKTKYNYKVENFEELHLAETISNLKKQYPEITEISIDHNQFVELQGISEEGEEIKAIINPNDGKILGQPLKESNFIKEVKSLHRSLFLHEEGRFLVGLVSFFLFLITITGIMMIIKMKGIRKFFSKIPNDFFSQWFHIGAGRWLLIPILILSITGTYLFAKRFKLIPEQKEIITQNENKNTENQVETKDFPIFRNTKLSEVKKVEFPFIEDDPEESFILKLKDRELEINAFSGEITKEKLYPSTQIWADINLNLHTGQTNAIWAAILGISSLGILGFIYTGFAITWRRLKSTQLKNKFSATNAEIILLVGSENGTTMGFAKQIHKQLLEAGKSVFITYLNKYQPFSNAKKIIIFTSTYGEGDAPTNAEKFEKLLHKFPQPNMVDYSVVGFGSKSYAHFCGYAIKVDSLLKDQTWTRELVPIHTINDRSPEEFIHWIQDFSEKSGITLSQNSEMYQQKIEGLSKFKVIKKSPLDEKNETFSITLQPENKEFSSGDILAIYPENNHKERQYSIGKIGDNIQLFVKLHPFGLGSQFLYHLEIGQSISAKILANTHFHFPKNAKKVVMIANGTGIAPFLGMMDEKSVEKHLYCGFRYPTEATQEFINIAKNQGLSTFKIGYSKGENPKYVMDLILEDEAFFTELLNENGVIMICGAIAMQKNVEQILATICDKNGLKTIEQLKKEGKILTDCY